MCVASNVCVYSTVAWHPIHWGECILTSHLVTLHNPDQDKDVIKDE